MTFENDGLVVDAAHMESFGENCARKLRPGRRRPARGMAVEVRRSLRELSRACAALQETGSRATGAARWLLDNLWLARREGLNAAEDLSNAGKLRGTAEGPLLGGLCRGFLQSGPGELSEARCAAYLKGFQRQVVLELGELALFPAGLKAAILEALAALYRPWAGKAQAQEPEGAEKRAEALFEALRGLSAWELGPLLEETSVTEAVLRADPAGIYPQMAEESRAYYRQRLAELARKRRISEHRAAEKVLELAQASEGVQAHVGWWLLRWPLGRPPRRQDGGAYIGANLLLTLTLSLYPALALDNPALFFLMLLPVSEAVKQVLDFFLLRLLPPAVLPRLAIKEGVPAEGRTLCAVSTLLERPEDVPALAGRLEQLRLLSRDAGPELRFALLADLPESAEDPFPGQEALLSAAVAAVEDLNRRYGGGFFLLTRPRRRTPEGRWSGWERKRGALLETMRLLRELPSEMTAAAGDPAALTGTSFLLALDSDTRLTPGAARALIAAALHPLNRPRIDPDRGLVTGGHGILSPRVDTELASAGKSDFSRLFAGPGGTDPYGGECSDLSMDLWGRGGFYGKGLIHIDSYLACMGRRVPENRMLSHDSVECAFLRGGLLSGVSCTDGFPGSPLSYYSRLERWTRGDWQNLPWIFSEGRDLPAVERWKLLDSLRRSLCPAAALAALVLGFLLPDALAVSGLAAGLTLLAELFLTTAEVLTRRERPGRFQSAVFVGFGGGMVRTLLRLLLLPIEAAVCCAAACRGVWRLLVSRKHLLDWRTAAQGERGGGLRVYYLRFLFAPLLGLTLLLLSPTVIGKAAGLLWALSPLCAWLLAFPSAPISEPGKADRDYLLGCARDTWVFFAKSLGPEDHWLPPDNRQVQPPVGLAHRTSPTNIGLGLLSVLAAADLGFLSPGEAGALIGHSLDSVEALPRWHGHLYNWYDTRSLTPLPPQYVSTVDSGNLCACLIALKSGLREYGFPALAERAGALADAMDFRSLYDPRQRLFSIGYDLEKQRLTPSRYDLMSSEARLTAYLAVARGDVPPEHWRALSRAQVAWGRYQGMVSWTGTMFEYLMPELLLPLYRDSLFFETARFCLYVQRKRAGDRPWGTSESAYCALDPSMNYRYKAHGCAGLALRPGMDEEYVVSPYSSFLALILRPKAALENLRRLERMGLRGDQGFWEALDYSAARGLGEQPGTVRCWMAHHQGMSLLACDNLLRENTMVRRFLEDSAMRAYACLLEERIPVGAAPLRRRVFGAAPEPLRPAPPAWSQEGEGTDFRLPRCCLLAGQSYSLLVAETGLTRPLWGAVSPYYSPASPLEPSRGMDFFFDTEERRLSLLPTGAPPAGVRYSWGFTMVRAEFRMESLALRSRLSVTLSPGETGELRRLVLENTGKESIRGTASLRFRPLLVRMEDYESHPSFAGLGISARREGDCLLLRRLPRGKTGELWLCLAPSVPCNYDLDPGGAGRRGTPRPPKAEERFLTDPLASVSFDVALSPGKRGEFCFALALAHSAAEALASARRMLDETGAADLPARAAAVLGLGAEDLEAAYALLPRLCFPPVPAAPCRPEALWRFGISGDLPLVCVPYGDERELETARRLMNLHLYLCGCGTNFDLVFLSSDGAGYHKPLQTALSDTLRRQGGELLRDRRGGVHIVEEAEGAVIRGMAAVLLDPRSLPRAQPQRTDLRFSDPLGQRPPVQRQPDYRWTENGTFRFTVERSLPRRAWQLPLTNGQFGYLATDTGCGHLWYRNAREFQLSPWTGRPRDISGPEALFLRWQGRDYSLFASPEGSRCIVSYRPGAAVWETRFGPFVLSVTAFVPMNTDCRVLLLRMEGPMEEAELHWRLSLRLGGSAAADRCCRCVYGGGFLAAENPQALDGNAPKFLAMATGGISTYTFDRAAALARNYNEQAPEREPVFAVRLRPAAELALVCGCGEAGQLLRLTAAAEAAAALEHTLRYWEKLCGRLKVNSGYPPMDRWLNGWAVYQVLAGRLLGRCSMYQSGGAYGFRDQLQDAVNLLLIDPQPARKQILRCCSRQYREGDVQHWWHVGAARPRGVRTHCSDDLLWLPWAVCEYVDKTGDTALCREEAPYLLSPPLSPGESDRYEDAMSSEAAESVILHCLRAIKMVMKRGSGAHGLLLMGSGDWNDGFSDLGPGGESVWLSSFFLLTAERFSGLLDAEGMAAEVAQLKQYCEKLKPHLEKSWDGAWYRRGYYSDGRPLGSADSKECQIDGIAQSFASFHRSTNQRRKETALTSAMDRLFDANHQLVKLFDPPFSEKENPGYIRSYGPGFRENGGQYTHGAVWLSLAMLRAGRSGEAFQIIKALLPAGKDAKDYEGEPYVLAADVYAAPGHEGEAGWTWYTGAAGWLFRCIAEELLGLKLQNGFLKINPKLPEEIKGCQGEIGEIHVDIDARGTIKINGKAWNGKSIPLQF